MSLETQQRIDQNRVLLGISSPFKPDAGMGRNLTKEEFYARYLGHVREDLERLVAGKHVVILGYGENDVNNVLGDIDSGITRVLKSIGARSVISTHRYLGRETSIIRDSEALYIHGGNTGILVANLHELAHWDDGSPVDPRPEASQTSLVEAIRSKVADGTPLVGVSAGFNAMAADIRTTNDMAAAAQRTGNGLVARLDALALFPPHLNFNAHFVDALSLTEERIKELLEIEPSLAQLLNYQGETRRQTIAPVLEMDHGRKVLALREGAYILVRGMEMKLEGTMGGVLFEYGKEPEELTNGDLSFLLLK